MKASFVAVWALVQGYPWHSNQVPMGAFVLLACWDSYCPMKAALETNRNLVWGCLRHTNSILVATSVQICWDSYRSFQAALVVAMRVWVWGYPWHSDQVHILTILLLLSPFNDSRSWSHESLGLRFSLTLYPRTLGSIYTNLLRLVA